METVSDVIDVLYSDLIVTLDESRRVVTVFRVKMKNLSKIMAVVNTFIQEIGIDSQGRILSDLTNSAVLLQLISKVPDEVNKILSLLTSLSTTEIEELDMADGAQLFEKVIDVNKSFFLQKVKPRISALMETSGLYKLNVTS